MTIGLRLTLAVVALLLAATGVVGWVAVSFARDSMVRRVDDRVHGIARRPPGPPRGPERRPLPPASSQAPYRDTAELRFSPDGRLVESRRAGFPEDPEPLPKLPAGAPESVLGGRIRTLPAVAGSLRYRVLAVPEPGGGVRVLAGSLADVDAAASRLLKILLLTGVGVMIVGALASWLVVRRGLRPVDRMVETAGAIASGDLTRRVETGGSRTELGRLGIALDLMLARLEQAFAQREESQDRLRRFLADASHELRTPVATIRGYAELYRRGGLADREALDRALGRIEGESARMGRLVEDLLLLARLEQDQPLERAHVDFARLVEDAVGDLRALGGNRPVDTSLAPAAVIGDEARLRQVVGNLLANARVHTPDGTAVHVRLARDDTMVTLTVADEGPGLPAGAGERVFERFYRGGESRRSTPGTGLGLAIVAAVVEAHGGEVRAESAPGEGATFIVRLPRSG